ncbi:MAG: PIN domain-containing protein [Paracoccaceae bacterium]|nr:PIN domain-containing protein [Paracoccaceae bacterium]MDO7660114.1 PIN domain-containing protein [Paracoccaceae bacterium]
MRAVLDACVLYPPVLRALLLGAARAGLYQPLWSERILEEWARATKKLGPAAEAEARIEVALTKYAHPSSLLPPAYGLEKRLFLPDENDIHVLAVAIAGSADAIVTWNRSDFPRQTLAYEGVDRCDPDGFLWKLQSQRPACFAKVLAEVNAKSSKIASQDISIQKMLKKAKLPRLLKAVLN